MPFIGNKPSAVPLTSADITDDIIVNADINSSAAIALTKLASTGTLTVDNIQFPATQVASANANNLDDYEEGTYTIATNTNLTANSGYAVFQYTKIGRQVTVSGGLVVSSVSSTNTVTISLPFQAKGNPTNGQGTYVGAVLPLAGVDTGDAGIVAYINALGTNMFFYKINDNAVHTSITNSDLVANDELLVTITYFI